MSGTGFDVAQGIVWLLSAGVFAVGMRGLWVGRSRGDGHVLADVAGLAVVAAATMAAWERPVVVAVPLGVLAGLAVLSRGGLAVPLARPRVRAYVLILAGPALAVGWSYPSWPTSGHEFYPEQQVPIEQRLVPAARAHAFTDYGRRVALYRVADANSSPGPLRQEAAQEAQARALRLLRTAPPDETSNCHGWVFTAGVYWVLPDDVEHVLEENGYAPVSVPRADDLVVYRNSDNEVEHTGIVRAVTPDGLILVESTWGQLGRYVHTPDDSLYGNRYDYYRTGRPRHTLTIHAGTPP